MRCGYQALEKYKKEWNDRHGCWSSCSLHNFASHGADAFRMMVVSINNLAKQGLTAEEGKNLRAMHI